MGHILRLYTIKYTDNIVKNMQTIQKNSKFRHYKTLSQCSIEHEDYPIYQGYSLSNSKSVQYCTRRQGECQTDVRPVFKNNNALFKICRRNIFLLRTYQNKLYPEINILLYFSFIIN